MICYPKIQNVFLRDNSSGLLLDGQWRCPEFAYLAGAEWHGSEKVDGTNIRVGWVGGRVLFGGRTDNAQFPAGMLGLLGNLFGDGGLREVFGENDAVLFGEGFGAGIQNGGGYSASKGFVLFDVWCGDLWLSRDAVEDIGSKLSVPVAPVVVRGTLLELVEFARAGFASQLPGATCRAEGLVARPAVELQTRRGERLITKLKTRDFAADKGAVR